MNLTYDLGRCPASWDFLQWLINVKLFLNSRDDPEFGVHFKPGPKDGFRNDTLARPIEQRRAILDHVMRPALQLIGAKEVKEGVENNIPYVPSFAIASKGHKIPKWTIPDIDVPKNKIIITLRETTYYPERNSNLPAWLEFANGKDVIFVRDTAKADEPLGFETSPRASRDFLYRAALMAHAKCNLMVANGPIALSMYMDSPWLCFGTIRNMPNYAPAGASWWAKMGCPVGSQFPWSNDKQRMTWNLDTVDNIEAEYANTIR